MSIMDTIIYHGAVTVTGWKLLGWTGALCFGARWPLQAWHRRRTGSAAMPTAFWWFSLVGAAMTLAYFVCGEPDSVGILQNALPLAVAGYNVWLDLIHRRQSSTTSPT